jgi:hypothetical protein
MAQLALSQDTKYFNDILGNGLLYKVPPFQRDYSWNEEEWEDLWYDLDNLTVEGIHYMGYVVLQPTSDSERILIIDGQQRLITLSILFLAGLQLLKDWEVNGLDAENNSRRREILRRNFLEYEGASSLRGVSRLTLNLNNEYFYKTYLFQLRNPGPLGKAKPSEKRLWKAFEFFMEKLETKFPASMDAGAELSRFLEEIVARRLLFTVINVSDDLNAYKVFETLNARGVKLSTSDLLKNYLFSLVFGQSPLDLPEAEARWQTVNERLGRVDFTAFLRHYYNSLFSLERKTNLFRAIKQRVTDAQTAFDWLDRLERAAGTYVAFSEPDNERWDENQRRLFQELRYFDATQCYPLLLSAYENLSPENFSAVLRDCVVITFRYTIISGLNPNELERVYNQAAMHVSGNSARRASDVFALLNSVYVPDESFKSAFQTRQFSTNRQKRLVRYILFRLEKQLSGQLPDLDDKAVTIEHVLPESYSEVWEVEFTPAQHEDYVYRLGNLTLLEEAKNKDCGTKPFPLKREIYQTSRFELPKLETNVEEWKPENIGRRQRKMAQIAASVWKIQY